MQHIVDFQVTWLVIKTKWLHQNYCVSAYKEHGSWPEASKADVVGQFCQKLHKEVLCSASLTIKEPHTTYFVPQKNPREKWKKHTDLIINSARKGLQKKKRMEQCQRWGLKHLRVVLLKAKKCRHPKVPMHGTEFSRKDQLLSSMIARPCFVLKNKSIFFSLFLSWSATRISLSILPKIEILVHCSLSNWNIRKRNISCSSEEASSATRKDDSCWYLQYIEWALPVFCRIMIRTDGVRKLVCRSRKKKRW